MNVHYWAGCITPELILQNRNIAVWAAEWLNKAMKAEAAGNDLIVFEVPKKELARTVSSIESAMQDDFPIPGL